jgi:hypothetical protein
MNREAVRLLQEAVALERKPIGRPLADELARFNAERARALNGQPPAPGDRIPLPRSGVGGDLE